MTIIKSGIIAFSMYSNIPMPQFEWKENDMKYALCFFPWVGAVIGLLTVAWGWFCQRFGVGRFCFTCIGTAIPLLVTGGFHVDGYMDTMDAFHSYREKEKKLEILKDAHIGAFSVIMLLLNYLIYMGAYSEIQELPRLALLGGGFFLSRTLSGLGVVCLRSAKKEGLLRWFADRAQARTVKVVLLVQLALCLVFLVRISLPGGLLVAAASLVSFGYYRFRSYKEIGGITGDTAGFFVTVCETAVAVAVAVL
ncbi:MAG: adenosylcobinamide-GDP ribazoletransferase [Lachnospiraceae bacterium]|nr:adenosylcobinamide-GDP ribazoletransferase [Lachnospiraceae bacterium]